MSDAGVAAALLAATLAACTAATDRMPIDCTIARPDTRLSECPVVRRASEFGRCLSRDEIGRHACVVMDTDLTLCDDEPPMPITLWFDQSDRTLDCAGGIVDHGWGRHGAPDGTPATDGAANLPLIRFAEDRSLGGVTVQDCTLRGTLQVGVQMTRFFGGQLGGDGELGPDEPMPLGHHDLLFRDVLIQDVRIGMYLGNFSRDVTLERVRIDGTERISLYSEAGTHRLSVRDSSFTGNRTREAIALDSTYDSEIVNSTVAHNREGGVFVYRNCGELAGTVCPVVRSTAPNDNRFAGNRFVANGDVDLQIASRQGRRHRAGWCAALDGKRGRFIDTAERNTVEHNLFVCREGTALAVRDGPNLVRDNRIVARGACVPLEISTGGFGRRAAPLLDGLVVTGNDIDASRPPLLEHLDERRSGGVRFEP